ncbi:MAG: 8-amino-7-oxononanoate synthase [Myxococcota bacterium]
MTRPILQALSAELVSLEERGLGRRLQVRQGIDFSSNDYLGFAEDPSFAARVRAAMEKLGDRLGAPASRLLGGTTELHLSLETSLARWKGQEAAILFPSGYQANLALLSTLVKPNDRVLSDANNHASIIDGLRLAAPATKIIYPHLDLATVEFELKKPHPGGQTFLVTEALFSMDGDLAPLRLYADLAEKYGAQLIVDEAHASGLYGARGSGWVEHLGLERRVLAVTSTLGKSLALAGALVSAPRTVIDYLIQRARPLIYSTAWPPVFLVAIEAALARLLEEPTRGIHAIELAVQLRRRLRAEGLDVRGDQSPIVPWVIGDETEALRVAEQVGSAGFDVRAVRPPTVAPSESRIRLSAHANHTDAQISALAQAVLASRTR